MEAVWGSDTADIDEHTAPKRQRLFIARQACENCRQKKTRCDGGSPCGLCRTAGVTCRFAERKATKNEVSLGMIFNTLQRIESKIEEQHDLPQTTPRRRNRTRSLTENDGARRLSTAMATADLASPAATTPDRPAPMTSPSQPPDETTTSPLTGAFAGVVRRSAYTPVIQYPIRQMASWPAIRALLDAAAAQTGADFAYDAAVATVLEQRRTPLPLPVPALLRQPDWLAQLHVSVVKEFGEAYFATFNLVSPVLDRRLFWQHSLGVAVNSEFGINMESCVVLVTMALGALGRRALVQTGLEAPPLPDDAAWDDGLVFFHEARKRIGLLGTDNSLQACQYYLLAGLFYSQHVRPVDFWSSVSRASTCCASFWACVPTDCDEWILDMQARLFWISAMYDAVLTQELDLPASGLLPYEERVPLPRFVEFPSVTAVVSSLAAIPPPPSATAAREVDQDAFGHYHFLSQIAHRIILTRVCDSLYASRSAALATRPPHAAAAAVAADTLARSAYPPKALEDELLHQLEQWRSQLPESLQWRSDTLDTLNSPADLTTPADFVVVPWLRARYCITRYHLRRPLLHRALHHPDWMSADDYDKCRDALVCAVDWLTVLQPSLLASDCLPLTFFVCTQLFGQLLLLHALHTSAVPELPLLVPANYAAWRVLAFRFLEQCAPHSPLIAREYEIVTAVQSLKEVRHRSGSIHGA